MMEVYIHLDVYLPLDVADVNESWLTSDITSHPSHRKANTYFFGFVTRLLCITTIHLINLLLFCFLVC